MELVVIFTTDGLNCSTRSLKLYGASFPKVMLLRIKNKKKQTFPSINHFKDKSLCIFFSDFLFDSKDFNSLLKKCKKKEIQGYIIQILDPMEINFKLSSATMFLS